MKTKEKEDEIELRRLRTENRLLRQRVDLLEQESSNLADRLIQGQVTRAEVEETTFAIKRELAAIRQHDLVERGDLLYQFETQVLQRNLGEVEKSIAQIDSENAAITAILSQKNPFAKLRASIASPLDQERFQHRLSAHQLELGGMRERADAGQKTIQLLREKLLHTENRVSLAEERLTRGDSLVAKGALTKQKRDETAENLQALLSSKADVATELSDKEQQISKLQADADLLDLKFRAQLLDTHATNSKNRITLEKERLALKAQIDAASVYAPIDGAIMSIEFDTVDMFAPRGSTLLVLGNQLDQPQVSLLIPTSSIDQVSVGREGKLTVPALPQRNLPQVHATIVAISPDVEKNAEGAAIGYRALAEINLGDLQNLRDSFDGELSLSNGMPVSMAIHGRNITFAQYMIAPFLRAFNGALVD